MCELSVSSTKGCIAMFVNALVTSGKDFQASHAIFFPFPLKPDVVSHPVKLWKTGSAEDFSLPNRVQTELMCQLEKFLPFPKATQILMLGFKESR